MILMYIFFIVCVGVYADKQNRSVPGSVLLALVISPLLTFIALALAGKKDDPVKEA